MQDSVNNKKNFNQNKNIFNFYLSTGKRTYYTVNSYIYKTKKVLHLIILYSDVTHSELLRKKSKLKLSNGTKTAHIRIKMNLDGNSGVKRKKCLKE